MVVINKQTGKLLSDEEFARFAYLMKLLYHWGVVDDDLIHEIVRNYINFPPV